MYPVSTAYKTAVNARERVWQVKMDIDVGTQVLTLTGADIIEKSLKITESVISGSTFSLGGIAAVDFAVSIVNNNGQYDAVQLNGAIVRPQIGLKVASGYEWVPLGEFVIDTVARAVKNPGRPIHAINMQGGDNMLLFDTSFSNVDVSFPCTALELLSAICDHCGVSLSTTSFLNDNYTIAARPDC